MDKSPKSPVTPDSEAGWEKDFENSTDEINGNPDSPVPSDVEDDGGKDAGKLVNETEASPDSPVPSDAEDEGGKGAGNVTNETEANPDSPVPSFLEDEGEKDVENPTNEMNENPDSPVPSFLEDEGENDVRKPASEMAENPDSPVPSDAEDEGEKDAGKLNETEANPDSPVPSDAEDEGEKELRKSASEMDENPDSPVPSDAEDEGEKDVGKLINNIFGDESDNEGDAQPDEGEEGTQLEKTSDQEEEEKEWDFDRIIAEKKKERGTKRRRRRDGSIDLCQNADGQIRHVVELMKNAAADDREANHQRRPAIKKTQMIDVVKSLLMRSDFFEALLENDMMAAVSEWLAPLPDKSLPALEIRSTLLKILDGFPTLEPGILKCSGLGKAVMLIHKHPKETKENKSLAARLIRKWSQPIFQINADFANITREDRERLDMDLLPDVKRRKIEEKYRAGSSSQRQTKDSTAPTLEPGQKGYINRARVPKRSTSAYIIRPKPNIDGPFRGASKNHVNSRFDRTTREFKERNKGSKAQRAIGVSIEGRKMEI